MAGWISIVGRRVRALLADTLFKRLFALMWLALVISHAVAFLVVTRDMPGGAGGRMPTFPSLPPLSFGQRASPASVPANPRPGGLRWRPRAWPRAAKTRTAAATGTSAPDRPCPGRRG